ncbi:hypothetical protein DDE01_02900 [Desulfovibrio desulfuricans]|nr:hypothetical protein DDE01_02900 [Desulfovibrio desulfuricans]
MSLRSTVQTWAPPARRIPDQPERTIKAMVTVAALLGNGTVAQPQSWDLERIFDTLRKALQRDGTIAHVEARTLRYAPWVLFRSFNGYQGTLGERQDVATAYAAWLEQQHSARPVLTLLHVLLRDYPTTFPTFGTWCRMTEKALAASPSPRLKTWRERCNTYGLLAPDGPKRVAGRLAAGRATPHEVLAEAGLEGELAVGGFAEQAFRQLLHQTSGMLEQGKVGDTLTRLTQLVPPDVPTRGRALRFPAQAVALADSLLMPFVKSNNAGPFKKQVRQLLLDHLGDPRIEKRVWPSVREEARAVLLGWLVEQSLEAFFRILDSTADPIWQYRKAFWMRYLEKGVITEAWVALGRKAQTLAREHFGKGYAKLAGATSDQSVLLMRIGGLTIAEWSHNGTCRIWRTPTYNTPVFYQQTYHGADLRTDCDFSAVHMGSEKWAWQRKIADYIRNTTNILWQ